MTIWLIGGLQIMKDPVTASDGITYKRTEVHRWHYKSHQLTIHKWKCKDVCDVFVVLLREKSVESTLWYDRAVQFCDDSLADTFLCTELRCMYVLHLLC